MCEEDGGNTLPSLKHDNSSLRKKQLSSTQKHWLLFLKERSHKHMHDSLKPPHQQTEIQDIVNASHKKRNTLFSRAMCFTWCAKMCFEVDLNH